MNERKFQFSRFRNKLALGIGNELQLIGVNESYIRESLLKTFYQDVIIKTSRYTGRHTQHTHAHEHTRTHTHTHAHTHTHTITHSQVTIH